MTRYIPVLTAMMLLATPAAGQSTARAQASIRIGEIMSLEVRPGGSVAVLDEEGVYRELAEAVSLEVFANRPWELFVVSGGPVARVASREGAAPPERAVWWRVDGADRSVGAFRPVERWPVLVGSGAGGRATLTVDYRWLDGPGREVEPGTVLHYTLAPR